MQLPRKALDYAAFRWNHLNADNFEHAFCEKPASNFSQHALGVSGLFLNDRRANVATTFALFALPLIAALGWGVDYSLAAKTRARQQSAVDAGVLAGIEESTTGSQAAARTVASHVFSANAPNNATATFAFNGSGSLTGTATYNYSTIFGGLIGASKLSLGAHAQATLSGSSVCMLLLDQSATGLLLNSGANISASNCEVDVRSTGSPAATFNAGSTLNANKICVQGVSILNNGGTHPNLGTGCSTVANPFVGKLPAPPSTTCSGPFAYCGWFNFNNAPTINFAPGVYVISGGGWNVDGGKWSGNGVTFYFADTSKIQFNSGMSTTLSAPTSGTYAGILFYEKDGLALSPFVFDDSVFESLNGLIYLPSRQLTFNSTANLSSQQVTLVADSAIFNTVNWTLSASSSWGISNTSSGSVALTQ